MTLLDRVLVRRTLSLTDTAVAITRVAALLLGISLVAVNAQQASTSIQQRTLLAIGLLTALAALSTAIAVFFSPSKPIVPALEGAAATAIILVDVPQTLVLLPYLIAPALAGGLVAGTVGALLAAGVPTLILVARLAPWEDPDNAARVLQWATVTLGVGLLGAWIRVIQTRASADDEDLAYQQAQRLLSELHALVRPLAGGLDARPIAASLLDELSLRLPVAAAAVLVDPTESREVAAQVGETPAAGWTPETHSAANGTPLLSLRVEVDGRQSAEVSVLCSREWLPSERRSADAIVSRWANHLDAAVMFRQVQALATQAERARIARDMHDGVAQDVASLGYLVDELIDRADDGLSVDDLERLREAIGQVVGELRLSIYDLRDDGIRSSGLAGAVGELARREASLGRNAVHLRLHETRNVLPADVEGDFYRIAQEALTNARRHSGAANVWVTVAVGPGGAVLEVADDGQGMGTPRADSMGLTMMAERAARIGATLQVSPRAPRGTVVRVELVPAAGALAS
jgi:signal transduction histidine kinase